MSKVLGYPSPTISETSKILGDPQKSIFRTSEVLGDPSTTISDSVAGLGDPSPHASRPAQACPSLRDAKKIKNSLVPRCIPLLLSTDLAAD